MIRRLAWSAVRVMPSRLDQLVYARHVKKTLSLLRGRTDPGTIFRSYPGEIGSSKFHRAGGASTAIRQKGVFCKSLDKLTEDSTPIF